MDAQRLSISVVPKQICSTKERNMASRNDEEKPRVTHFIIFPLFVKEGLRGV